MNLERFPTGFFTRLRRLSDENIWGGGQKGGGCGGSMGSSEPGAGSTKGQEDFMMAHMGEERSVAQDGRDSVE